MVLVVHKWLLLAYLSLVHPLFVAVTEINHNAQEKTLEISCKAFTDDLEKSIEKSTNQKVDLFNVKDKAVAEKAITEYFRKHLILKADGKAVQFELIGFEREFLPDRLLRIGVLGDGGPEPQGRSLALELGAPCPTNQTSARSRSS